MMLTHAHPDAAVWDVLHVPVVRGPGGTVHTICEVDADAELRLPVGAVVGHHRWCRRCAGAGFVADDDVEDVFDLLDLSPVAA